MYLYFLLIVSLLFTGSAFAQTLCTPIGNSIYWATSWWRRSRR